MKIYLVGFMGAGKTTVGRELAARIDAPFFDLDELVESAEKMRLLVEHVTMQSGDGDAAVSRSLRTLRNASICARGVADW
jgi:shikimate kinase